MSHTCRNFDECRMCGAHFCVDCAPEGTEFCSGDCAHDWYERLREGPFDTLEERDGLV
jgi:hypothetical protein